MSGYYPDGLTQASFDGYWQYLDDPEPEVIGSCVLCGDNLIDENAVLVNHKLHCIDCADSICNEDQI